MHAMTVFWEVGQADFKCEVRLGCRITSKPASAALRSFVARNIGMT